MIALAQSNLGSERILWRQADALELPFGDAEFDVVVCHFGAMFFPDKRRGFQEAFRVLRPGGHFLLNVWDSFGANSKSPLSGSWLGTHIDASDPTRLEEITSAVTEALRSRFGTGPVEGPLKH